jgi:hypothetical protein
VTDGDHPSATPYDRQLVAEARRRGFPAPQPSEVNKPWRRHLERLIGRAVVLELLLRRKRGERGPNKKYNDKPSTKPEYLRKKKEAYDKKHKPTLLSLLGLEKK